MIENRIVVVKKEKENSRNHKLYLRENNLLVSVPLQLDIFETAFKTLLSHILQNITDTRANKFPDKIKEELSKMDDANFYSLLQCIQILDKISSLYTTYSVIEWPDKMQDDKDLRELFSYTFNKLADLRFHISKTLIKTFSKIYSQIGNMPLLREAYATALLEQSIQRFNNANLHQESQPLISCIWNIHMGVERWAFPEPLLYKRSFSFHEGHEKFIELCKQNPNQRKDNLTPEEFETIHRAIDKSSF
jgi:hypothetical protein